MSQAHKNSRLLIKDVIYAVPFETALFNFNEDAIGIQYGDIVKPMGTPVATFKKDGKFGNGVEVGSLSYSIDIVNPKEGTVSFWMKGLNNSLPLSNNDVFRTGARSDPNAIVINIDALGIAYQYGFGNRTANYADSNMATRINYWNHYAISWDAVYVRGYLNGEKVVEGTGGTQLSSHGSVLNGFLSIGTTNAENFVYDELRIDAVSVDSEEIFSWYVSDSPFYNPYDLRAYGY